MNEEKKLRENIKRRRKIKLYWLGGKIKGHCKNEEKKLRENMKSRRKINGKFKG